MGRGASRVVVWCRHEETLAMTYHGRKGKIVKHLEIFQKAINPVLLSIVYGACLAVIMEVIQNEGAMNYWLVKTEPDVYSIEDLRRDKFTAWTGVRNYQARNFLTAMKVGDKVLIYHSNAKPPGVVGVGVIKSKAVPDETQFEEKGEYYDPKATREKPRWFCPDIRFVQAFRTMVSLDELREDRSLKDLLLLQRGSRLSVIPVEEKHFTTILSLAEASC